jgi:subtilisin family serine protease
MKKILFTLILIALFLAACGPAIPTPAPITFPKIDRHPAAADYSGMNQYSSLPKYDPNSQNPLQMDLRSTDLSELDLSQSRDDLMYAIFDSKTTWPENMPADFDWQAIMETGKNPGLGVRSLHERGITGKGVGIAIIDQPLLVEHQEYATQLRLYEEINIQPGTESQMHGPAVASIAVGKTVGVAPGADLYYIASWAFDNSGDNFTYKAQAIRRIIEINTQLPSDRKIRVISISVGWQKDQTGYNEITDAVNEAKAAGIFVISSSIEKIYGLKFHGLGRNPLANPDDVSSYLPGSWWAKDFYAGKYGEPRLLVPMDSRTTASPNGNEDYVFYREGGWSWSIPYLAGMYALAAQVDPAITPDKFWKLAMETGQTIEILHEGQSYQLGPILDPAALIAALKH